MISVEYQNLAIVHQGHSILSLDLSPIHEEPFQLATAGKDGSLKVWSIGLDHGSAPEECKCVTTLVEHLAPVNCVRWSVDASYIASGDADAMIFIWSRDVRLGQWRRKWMLRGHDGEVCDLSWHPLMHPRFTLASCSFDGTIRLWNATRGETVAVLRSPDECCIKGVAFDPVGQFLAAMPEVYNKNSSCNALLWECVDDTLVLECPWQPVHMEGFPRSTSNSLGASTLCLSRRPSWDPLGKSVIFPCGEASRHDNATPRYFGVLFERHVWSPPKRYRGHLQAVSIARFSPSVFAEVDKADESSVMCALASNNGTLTLWSSELYRPIITITGILQEDDFLTDMCWTPTGTSICFSTNHGYVGWLRFPSLGVGNRTRLNREEIYCRRLDQYTNSTQPSWHSAVNIAHLNATSGMTKKRQRESSPTRFFSPTKQKEVCVGDMASWEPANKTMKSTLEENSSNRHILQPKVLSIVCGGRQLHLHITHSALPKGVSNISVRSACGGMTEQHSNVTSTLWQVSMHGFVSQACICSRFMAFVIEQTIAPNRQLFLVNTQTGQQITAPMVLGMLVNSMDFSLDGCALLLVTKQLQIYVWKLVGDSSPTLVLKAPLPSCCTDVNQFQLCHETFVPFFWGSDGSKYIFQEGQETWCRITSVPRRYRSLPPPAAQNNLL